MESGQEHPEKPSGSGNCRGGSALGAWGMRWKRQQEVAENVQHCWGTRQAAQEILHVPVAQRLHRKVAAPNPAETSRPRRAPHPNHRFLLAESLAGRGHPGPTPAPYETFTEKMRRNTGVHFATRTLSPARRNRDRLSVGPTYRLSSGVFLLAAGDDSETGTRLPDSTPR
ncbi:TPA: hypothetical protein BOS_8937 [Bos taurus]|nr:TPA: hypothetical protein BOS_8937 [Bos taurus]